MIDLNSEKTKRTALVTVNPENKIISCNNLKILRFSLPKMPHVKISRVISFARKKVMNMEAYYQLFIQTRIPRQNSMHGTNIGTVLFDINLDNIVIIIIYL